MPIAYRRRGTRIFVFAGDEAWRCARQFLDSGEIHEARYRYTVVAPTSMPDRDSGERKRFKPYNSSWPVFGLPVLVVDCGAGEQFVDELSRALQRDGATDAQLLPYPASYPDQALSLWQPWHPLHADWWDTDLQPPFGAASYWSLVGDIERHLNLCPLADDDRALVAELMDAPPESAGHQALCLAWRDGSLRQRLVAHAGREAA